MCFLGLEYVSLYSILFSCMAVVTLYIPCMYSLMYGDLSLVEVIKQQEKSTQNQQVTLQSDTMHPTEKNDNLKYWRNIFYILYNF